MNIGYIGGFWSSNIGNSFYNIGMLWLLKSLHGDRNIHFLPDPPQVNWPTLKNDYDFISKVNIDLYIISGPVLGYGISQMYSRIFDEISKKGGRIGFVSAGALEYTENEAQFVSKFLNSYNVSFVFTRDAETFKLYCNKLKSFVYDGLCTSMFLNDAICPPKINDDYVVTNFNFWHEPVIKNVNDSWIIENNLFSKRQDHISGLPVVRLQSAGIVPNFRFFRTSKFLYTRPNMYYSDLPYGYLSILRSSKLVFSDRVHTCAAGLIFGAECMYIKGQRRSRDGRNNIFSRLGLHEIFNKPVVLDIPFIELEKKKMKDSLSLAINSVGQN